MKYKNIEGNFLISKIIKHALVLVLAFFFIFSSYTIVVAGERGVKLTLGQVSPFVWSEGIHFKIPFAQTIKILDIKIQKEEVEASAASKDLQNVQAKIALNYHLEAEKVNKLWQSVGLEYKNKIIDPAIQEAIKAITARYTAEELITKRSAVKNDAKIALTERLLTEFIIVDELSIVDFDFSVSFNQAIESKVTAEQNALAAKNKLEQVKYEAEQRIAEAKGEAEAIRIQAQAIQQQGGEGYVKLKWVEAWEKGGSKVPVTIIGEGGNSFLFNLDIKNL